MNPTTSNTVSEGTLNPYSLSEICEINFVVFSLHQMTPLHVAVKKGDRLDIVKILLDKGANINISDEYGVSESILLIVPYPLFMLLYCMFLIIHPL